MLVMIVIGLWFLVFAAGYRHEGTDNGHLFNFTIHKLMADYKKAEVLIRDKCTLQLLKEAVDEFGSTYMFITDNHYHTHLLHSLQNNFVHSFYTEPGQLTSLRSETFDNLLIFRDKFKLRDVIKMKAPFQATKFFLLVRDYEDAVRKFEILWKNRLVNAVASFVVNTTVYYYTYFPYSSTHCGKVGKPHLLARCDITNGLFSHREKLFPKKVTNLHRCPVRISFTEHVPACYYTEGKTLTGWEIDLLKEILYRINGVPNYHFLNGKDRVYKKSRGYTDLVENSEIGTGLVVSLRGLVETDFVMYGMSLCATWIVPRREGAPVSVDFLTKVFPPRVWLLILLTYIAMTMAIRAFYKVDCRNILFKLLAFLLATTTPTRRTSRLFGALWLWFCLTITAVYDSGFQSTLLVPNLPQQLSGTSEVLNSKLKILGVPDLLTDAIPFFKQRYNLSSRRYRNRKLTYEDWVYRMSVKKDSAFLGFKETVFYYIGGTELESQIHIPEDCAIKYHLAFVLKKHSHLSELVGKFSNRLNENGFLSYFLRKHLLNESRNSIPKKMKKLAKPFRCGACGDDMPSPINMDKISAVFMCLTGGILLALIAFVAELMSTWDLDKIKTTILRELQRAWPCY